MFETDDYDQILSQIDLPEVNLSLCEDIDLKRNINDERVIAKPQDKTSTTKVISEHKKELQTLYNERAFIDKETNLLPIKNIHNSDNIKSPKHSKRKIINSYFDHKKKRKFPGPAGLLSGSLEINDDKDICQLELLTQDMDFTQNYLQCTIFESPLWKRLILDTKCLGEINSINAIKTQALAGNLQRKKAQIVIAFVESVDRSAIDPLITLSDKTGSIKCTLHRDAWNIFSNYIVAEYCALVLWKPTVLTTGSAFKKHYLNITLGNISSIYTSTITNEDTLPPGYLKTCEDQFVIISIDKSANSPSDVTLQESVELEDLNNIFLDEEF